MKTATINTDPNAGNSCNTYWRGGYSLSRRLPKMSRRKEFEGRIRFYTAEDEKEILGWFTHIGKQDHYEAVIVLVDTGFRPRELWGCRAENVNRLNQTITLWKTKTGKPRTIPMTDRVRDIILRRCAEYPQGQLFPGSSNAWMRHAWDRVRALMGKMDDPEFIPYGLRHTCCSRLVQRGVPLTRVMAWMGHTSIQTTMRYAHLAPHDLFTLAQVLNGGDDTRWHNVEADNALLQ
jgi:Site-specific recombinase XerD